MSEDQRAALFVETLLPAFEQAAAIATALQGRVANRPKASEAGEVKAALTVADTAAQEALLVPLLDAFSRCTLEAEEDTPSIAAFRGDNPHERIVIDPIDGTFHFYLGGKGPYAVMAGWAHDEHFRAALVAVPTRGWVFHAYEGGGARRTRVPIRGGAIETEAVPPLGGDARRVLLSDTAPDSVHAALRGAGFEPGLASGGAISIAPLLDGVAGGIRFSNRLNAQGISQRGRIGLLIAREAGAVLSDAEGAAFPGDLDTPAETLIVARDADTGRRLSEVVSGARGTR